MTNRRQTVQQIMQHADKVEAEQLSVAVDAMIERETLVRVCGNAHATTRFLEQGYYGAHDRGTE